MSRIALTSFNRGRSLTYLSFGLLAIATLYSAWYANYFQSGNSDNIVYPYFFQHFQFHDMILPSQHANILKFPLFVLQALLPYNFATFSFFSIGLVLITTIVWVALLVRLFGRRYAPLICLSLVSVLVGSQLLGNNLLGTTIRNIEFPIVLAFVIFTGTLLQKQVLSRHKQIIGVVIGLLFALTLAGDSFFLYTACFSLLALLAIYWFQGVQVNKVGHNYRTAFAYAVGFSLLAFIIRVVVKILGIASYYTADVFKPHIVPLEHIGPSISTATTQVLNLFDANIFGLVVRPGNGLVFMNFLLLLVGVCGIVLIVHDGLRAKTRHSLIKRVGFSRAFSLTALALTGLVTYAVYIVSDLAVLSGANGQIISASQERYLTILPLILVAGIAYAVWRNFDTRQLIFIGLPVLIAIGLLVSIPSIKRDHVYNNAQREGPIEVATVAQANNVNSLVTGYWYGSSTKFWSGNKVEFSTIANCNSPQPIFNNRQSWYKPSATVHRSALVVSRTGPDAQFWICPDAQLVAIYGVPDKFVAVPGHSRTTLWIYNRDLRTSLKPFGVD